MMPCKNGPLFELFQSECHRFLFIRDDNVWRCSEQSEKFVEDSQKTFLSLIAHDDQAQWIYIHVVAKACENTNRVLPRLAGLFSDEVVGQIKFYILAISMIAVYHRFTSH